jgi:hypothetical protein
MKRLPMIRSVVALVACALLLPAVVANVKNPVFRPFKIEAQSQMVLNLADGSFNSTAWGEATHCGKFVNTFPGTSGLICLSK